MIRRVVVATALAVVAGCSQHTIAGPADGLQGAGAFPVMARDTIRGVVLAAPAELPDLMLMADDGTLFHLTGLAAAGLADYAGTAVWAAGSLHDDYFLDVESFAPLASDDERPCPAVGSAHLRSPVPPCVYESTVIPAAATTPLWPR